MGRDQGIQLQADRTALVCIDLQQGILEKAWHPRGSAEVLARITDLMDRFHDAGALVVLVSVGWAAGFVDAPQGVTDVPGPAQGGPLPEKWSQLSNELPLRPGDLRIQKTQWGAWEGTALETNLRRRGIETLVLTGIATNMGVESTARQGYEKNFNLILLEDAMTSFSAEAHRLSVETIFPRIGRVRRCCDLQFLAP